MDDTVHSSEKDSDGNGFTFTQLPEELVRGRLESLPNIIRPKLADELVQFRLEKDSDLVAATSVLRQRRNQAGFDDELKNAFKAAVQKMVDDGLYEPLVSIHTSMNHNMHGAMGGQFNLMGLLRFLGWHRQYILQFEELLIAADRDLRPHAVERLTLPFWFWNDPFPEWLADFLPANHSDLPNALPSRTKNDPPEKPDTNDVELILHSFRSQLPTTTFPSQEVADYVRFTYALEGWGDRPDGSSLPAHNHVHDWIGGIMSNTRYSPLDPMFWLHHAEVDRLWSIWQIENPNAHPPLTGAQQIFDPWMATYDTVKAVEGMGYTYEMMN